MTAGAECDSATKCSECDRVMFPRFHESLIVELIHIVAPSRRRAVLDSIRDQDRTPPVYVSFRIAYAALSAEITITS